MLVEADQGHSILTDSYQVQGHSLQPLYYTMNLSVWRQPCVGPACQPGSRVVERCGTVSFINYFVGHFQHSEGVRAAAATVRSERVDALPLVAQSLK